MDWLQKLQANDLVIYRTSGSEDRIAKVLRITKTQVYVDAPWCRATLLKFRRVDGNEIGFSDRFSSSKIIEATTTKLKLLQDDNAKRELIQQIQKALIDKDKLSIEQLIAAAKCFQQETTND